MTVLLNRFTGNEIGEFDISPGASLSKANLSGASLSGADLREANLNGANLSGADLDFSCWPLWCGSIDVAADERLAAQLLAHAFNLARDFVKPTPEQADFTNKHFHQIRSGEFPKIETE